MSVNATSNRYRRDRANEAETPHSLTQRNSRNAVILYRAVKPEDADPQREEIAEEGKIQHENQPQSLVLPAPEVPPSQPGREMYQELLEQRGPLRVTNGDENRSEDGAERDGGADAGKTITLEEEEMGTYKRTGTISSSEPDFSRMIPLRRIDNLPSNSTSTYQSPPIYSVRMSLDSFRRSDTESESPYSTIDLASPAIQETEAPESWFKNVYGKVTRQFRSDDGSDESRNGVRRDSPRAHAIVHWIQVLVWLAIFACFFVLVFKLRGTFTYECSEGELQLPVMQHRNMHLEQRSNMKREPCQPPHIDNETNITAPVCFPPRPRCSRADIFNSTASAKPWNTTLDSVFSHQNKFSAVYQKEMREVCYLRFADRTPPLWAPILVLVVTVLAGCGLAFSLQAVVDWVLDARIRKKGIYTTKTLAVRAVGRLLNAVVACAVVVGVLVAIVVVRS